MGARLLLVIAAASLLAGCGSRQVGGSGGLSGTVIISPATPVCRIGASCTRPARGLTLLFLHGGDSARAKTDKHGRFQIALSPGTYRLRVLSAGPGSRLKPRIAMVRTGDYGNLKVSYDPGIR